MQPRGGAHKATATQRPDRQIALHAVADGPANDAPRMQVQDHSQIQPALAGPDVTDIACPFLVWLGCMEVAIQQVRRDVEGMIAVRGRLEFACSYQ